MNNMQIDTANRTEPRDGAAVRLAGGKCRILRPGEQLTFGRNPDRDIRLAHDPVDDYVSRKAGTLIGQTDSVLVRNDSYTQDLHLQAFPGPATVVGPQATVGTSIFQQIRLVLPGRHGNQYALDLDLRGLSPRTGTAESGAPTNPRARVTQREFRLLAALCEPLLILAGDGAVPATYREIGARVGQSPAGVRNCLDLLRQRLTEVEGIPGLRADGIDHEPTSYRNALARWAVNSGTVGPAELRLL